MQQSRGFSFSLCVCIVHLKKKESKRREHKSKMWMRVESLVNYTLSLSLLAAPTIPVIPYRFNPSLEAACFSQTLAHRETDTKGEGAEHRECVCSEIDIIYSWASHSVADVGPTIIERRGLNDHISTWRRRRKKRGRIIIKSRRS